MTGRIRQNELLNRQQESQLSSLLKLTQQLVGAREIGQIARIAVAHFSKAFGAGVCLYLAEEGRAMPVTPHRASSYRPGEKEYGVATWVFLNRKAAGKFTHTLAGVDAQFLPVATERGNYGVRGIDLGKVKTLPFDQEALLAGSIQQVATAIERVRLIENAGPAE